jgi:hypothetical protein
MATWLRLKGDHLSAYGFENKGPLTNVGTYIKYQVFWVNELFIKAILHLIYFVPKKEPVRNLMKDTKPDQKLLDPVLQNLFDLRNFSRS